MRLHNYLVDWRNIQGKNSDSDSLYYELSETFDASSPFKIIGTFGNNVNDELMRSRPINVEQQLIEDECIASNIIYNRIKRNGMKLQKRSTYKRISENRTELN